MSSLFLRIALVIPLAALSFPTVADGQQANGFADHTRLSNRRTLPPSDVDPQRIKQDFNTTPRPATSAHIRLTGPEGSTNLRHRIQRPRQTSRQSNQVAPPVRFAAYEADLTPNLNQIELDQPPRSSTNEGTPNNNDLSGIQQALSAYRAQPSQMEPGDYDRHMHVNPAAMVANDQQTIQQDDRTEPSRLTDPATEQSNRSSLGFAVSDDSRKLIERIGYNLLFVLTLGIGFVFAAKKWMKAGNAVPQSNKSEFEVLNTLNLPGKASLLLIKVNSDRLMVAIDTTGVKSVVHLTDSFTGQIDAFADVTEQPAVNQLQQTQSFAEHLARETMTKPAEPTKKKQLEVRSAPRQNTAAKNTEAIQKQMEAALKKFGLKGLV